MVFLNNWSIIIWMGDLVATVPHVLKSCNLQCKNIWTDYPTTYTTSDCKPSMFSRNSCIPIAPLLNILGPSKTFKVCVILNQIL